MSVAYGLEMPSFEYVKKNFYKAISQCDYSINVVNSNTDVDILLDEETGELRLDTPFSIFVGGQVLDRGVTIPNMIGFYYGRNPKNMQQDTVLQHSRMFGYRKKFLPVTRFYTTERIHSNMEKITEIDIALREDIESGKQGNGVYFITRKEQDSKYGRGDIIPCSPDKIRASDIVLLNSHKRLLPIGFSPVCKTTYNNISKKIEKLLGECRKINKNTYLLHIEIMEKLLSLVYETFEADDESDRFIPVEEMITYLRYFIKDDYYVYCTVYRDLNTAKYRNDGRLQDSPDTGQSHLKYAKELAVDNPCLILCQENGTNEGWNDRAFWWPVLVAPKNVSKTIYATKVVDKKVVDKKSLYNVKD